MLVTVVAFGLLVTRLYWEQLYLTFTVYLFLLSTAIVAAVHTRGPFRGGFLGAAIFGTFYLACVLKLGLPFKDWSAFAEFNRNTEMGIAFLCFTFLSSMLLVSVFWRTEAPDSPREY